MRSWKDFKVPQISRTRHLYILICQLEFNAVYPCAIWVYSWAKRADDIMVDDIVI